MLLIRLQGGRLLLAVAAMVGLQPRCCLLIIGGPQRMSTLPSLLPFAVLISLLQMGHGLLLLLLLVLLALGLLCAFPAVSGTAAAIPHQPWGVSVHLAAAAAAATAVPLLLSLLAAPATSRSQALSGPPRF